ncbi:MAG: hypothetical protein RIM84_06240 [Alphaproteobacteria bacterium]
MNDRSNRKWLLVGLLAAVVLLISHFFTLRSDISWSGSGADLALSLIHGGNLLAGDDYFDNSQYTSMQMLRGRQPHTYPVLYSTLQAWLYDVFGQGAFLVASKSLGLLFFAVGMMFMFFLFGRRDGYRVATLSLVLFGTAPFFFELKEQVRSDTYFVGFLYGLFWYRTRMEMRGPGEFFSRATHLDAVILGSILTLMILMRSVSLAVLPALVLLDLVQRRRLTWTTIEAIAGALLIYYVQSQIFGNVEKGYAGGFHTEPQSLFAIVKLNLMQYIWNLRDFLSYGVEALDPISLAVFVVSLLMFAVGAVASNLKGPRLHDVFFLCYCGVLLVFATAASWSRYLIPLMPIFFYYVIFGIQTSVSWVAPRAAAYAMLAYVLVVGSMYVSIYATWINFGPFPSGPMAPDYVAIHDELERASPADAVVMSQTHEWTLVRSGRKSAEAPRRLDGETWRQELVDYIDVADISYIIVRHADLMRTGFYAHERWDQTDLPELRAWVEQTSDFVEISRHGPYRLYQKVGDGK